MRILSNHISFWEGRQKNLGTMLKCSFDEAKADAVGYPKKFGWQAFQDPQSTVSLEAIMWRDPQSWVRNLRQKNREATQYLAEYGWYVDSQMTLSTPHRLVSMKGKNPEAISEILSQFFRRRLNDIERELGESFPNRKHLLSDAFEAHREGKYSLAIPAFLIQADGMWFDKTSKNIFIRGDRETACRDCISSLENGILDSVVHVLSNSTPLWRSKSERNTSSGELNRHQILHGEATNYGTEQNSLKIISFMSFLNLIIIGIDYECIN